MAVETDADRTALLADFGESVTIAAVAKTAIFDNGFVAETLGVLQIESLDPSLMILTSDITGVLNGDAVVAGGVNYTIKSIEPDGTGMSRILLER